MNILVPILSLAFVISILRNALYLLFLWQLKEYRVDRFLVHLKTWQGKQLLVGKIAVIKWLLLLFSPQFLLSNTLDLLFLMVLAVFSFEVLLTVKQLVTTGWRNPILTLKTGSILTMVFFLFLMSFLFVSSNLLVKFLILDRVLFFLIFVLVVLTNIPAKICHYFTINQAKKMIKERPDLLTIGITGSYGKSTTKEFLAQILSQKYKVLKTPANINTDVGVAKVVLTSLKKEHKFFVCEMGAYKKGEIKAICDIVQPKIGIITGINEQHLALFGSLKNTLATKFELIEALPQNGLAVFNGENEYCFTLANKAKGMGREVKVIKQEEIDSKTNLPNEFFLINFLMAKTVAERLGIKSKEIGKAAGKLELPPHTMQILKKNGLTLIDDTYNSNPQGVLAALDFLRTIKGEKIFVFQPMIELGQASERLHEEVGKKAAEICNQIILTNKNFYQDFMEGVEEKGGIRKDLPRIKRGAILFEGREARGMLKLLKSSRACHSEAKPKNLNGILRSKLRPQDDNRVINHYV